MKIWNRGPRPCLKEGAAGVAHPIFGRLGKSPVLAESQQLQEFFPIRYLDCRGTASRAPEIFRAQHAVPLQKRNYLGQPP